MIVIRFKSENINFINIYHNGPEYVIKLKHLRENNDYVITISEYNNYIYLFSLFSFKNSTDFYFEKYYPLDIELDFYKNNPITEHILSEIFSLNKPADYALKNVLYDFIYNIDNEYYLDILKEKDSIIEYIKKCINNYKYDILPNDYVMSLETKLSLIRRIKESFTNKDKLYLIAKIKILTEELENLIMNI